VFLEDRNDEGKDEVPRTGLVIPVCDNRYSRSSTISLTYVLANQSTLKSHTFQLHN